MTQPTPINPIRPHDAADPMPGGSGCPLQPKDVQVQPGGSPGRDDKCLFVKAPAAESGVPAAGAKRTGAVKIKRSAFAALWNDPTVTTEQIAAFAGVARTSVTYMGYRMGLPPRKTGAKPKVDEQLFTRLWLAKVSTAEIAREMGMARNYPGVLARRLGLGNRPQGMRGTITMDDYRAMRLREALAASARQEQEAFRLAEMTDGKRDPRNTGRRVA